MRSFYLFIVTAFFISINSNAQLRDFGVNGLKGLTAEQLDQLSKDEIVLINADSPGTKDESFVQAALVFSVAPALAWKLISKTDDQPKYLDNCQEIKVVSTSPGKAYEVHTVGNMLVSYTYGVIENYFPEKRSLYWTLDPGYAKNDLNVLNGYWQLYPYGENKTLARYGSQISFKNIPEFLESMLKKSGVKDALFSVKEYVNSGGTYRK